MSNHISDLQALNDFNIVGNPGPSPKVIEVIWSLSPLGWVKTNSDGAPRASPGHASNGENMLGGFSSYASIQYSLLAEPVAAMREIETAKGKKIEILFG